jgi:hypothetical protein
MIRWPWFVIVLAGVGGLALGWYSFSPAPSLTDTAAPEGDCDACSRPAAPVRHEFSLQPADVNLHREKPVALAVDGLGRIVVAWASQTSATEYTLFLARSTDEGVTFAPPAAFRAIPVRKFKASFGGRERDTASWPAPRLGATGEYLVLSWFEPRGDGGAASFLTALSKDGGQTFAEPVRANRTFAGRIGFPTVTVDNGGAVACAWIDNRHGAQQPFCGVSDPPGGQFPPEVMVHAGPDGKGICPCCDLDVARTADGRTLVAFRNALAPHRDMYVARSLRGDKLAFAEPVLASTHHWKHDGCPHDGPSLAVTGDQVHLLWMDAYTGRRQVYLASAALRDLRFTPRLLCPNPQGEQGHGKLIAGMDGTLHAVWDETLPDPNAPPPATAAGKHQHGAPLTGAGRAIRYACSLADGSFTAPRPVDLRPGVFQIEPALGVGPTGLVHVAWVEVTEEGKRLVVTRFNPKEQAAASPGATAGTSCYDAPTRGAAAAACCEDKSPQ